MSIPHTVEASIISIISHIFSPTTVAAEESNGDTSQKMALLEAPVNPTATGSIPSPKVSVVDNALMPEGVVPPTAAISHTHEDDSESNAITTYTVKAGDNISTIAENNGISINTILWANNLKRDVTLKVGQKLVILPISGISHKIVSGDTLQAIAIKYHGDAAEIAAYNDIVDSKLQIGDIIVIPDGEPLAKPSTGISVTTPVSNISNSGYYIRPIKGGTKTQGIHGSNAVDLADACGTPIYAAAAGNVMISKSSGLWDGGYGNYVVISHPNGSQTLYAHMTKAIVSEGDSVTQGQMIGTIGATGKVAGATGCHVHFEIRNGGRNPF